MAANNPLPDQRERHAALDPERSFIVQAPAGAGKTELLTRRLLALLARVEKPEAIVALTFTKKAAAEMRERVLAALRGQRPDGQLPAPEVQTLVAAVQRRDRERGWHLTEHPARLRLQTIDAFTAGLAAQAPLASGLAGCAVRDDAGPVYRQAARALMRQLGGDDPVLAETRAALQQLLARLDNDWPRVEELLARMLPKRDQWLEHTVGKAGDAAAREELEAALQAVVQPAVARLAAAIPRDWSEKIAALVRHAAANVKPKQAPPAAPGMRSLPKGEVAEVDAWRAVAWIFLTQKGGPRANVDKRCGFPSDTPARQAVREAWQKARAALSEEAMAALAAAPTLPAAQYTEAQWAALSALLRLLPRAAALLEVQFQAEGVADFTAYTLAAARVLGGAEAPTEIAFAWDTRLEHLLVDEFQDTSQSQFDLLLRLTQDFQPGEGRTIFLVGDPMQSIYGFRQARVGLFLRLWEHRHWGQVALEAVQLAANFRSAPVLVDWFNQYLQAAFPRQSDVLTGAVPYASCEAVQSGAPGCQARFHCLPWLPADSAAQRGSVDRAAEAAEVVRLVRAARAAGENDIAVLVRVRFHAEIILAALAAAGIATVEALDHLGDRPAVRDLLALTRALQRPADRTAWLAVLRAPWCGLTLADLLIVAEGDGGIWDNCGSQARLQRLSLGGRMALDRCRPVFGRALEACGRGPLRRLVEGTWMELGGAAARRAGRPDWEDAQAFLDLLGSLDFAGAVDIEELERQAAGLRTAAVARKGAVQVMTIHQAKGLEFGAVILPGLDRWTASDRKELLAWQQIPADAAGQAGLLLAPIEAGGEKEPIYRYLRALGAEQRRQESIRLLYVAATRAKRRLDLLAGWETGKKPDSRSFAALLAPAGTAPEPMVTVGSVGAGAAMEAAAASPRRLNPAWKLPPPPPPVVRPAMAAGAAAVSFDWVHPFSRHVGVVVHAWLGAAMGREGTAPWSEAGIRARLAQEGVLPGEMSEGVARVRRAIELVLADERGRWLLAPHPGGQREWALAGVGGGGVRHVRLDRSFIHQGTRWIVDYKLSVHAGGGLAEFLAEEERRYRPQLEGYAALLAAGEQAPIQLGLYFPLVEEAGRPAWRAWPWARAAAAPAR